MYLERALAIRDKAKELDEKEKSNGSYDENGGNVEIIDSAFESFLRYFLVRVKYEIETTVQYRIDHGIPMEETTEYMVNKEKERTGAHNAAIISMLMLNRFARANRLPLFYDGPEINTQKIKDIDPRNIKEVDLAEKEKRSHMTDALFNFLDEADTGLSKDEEIDHIGSSIKDEKKRRKVQGIDIEIPKEDDGNILKVAAFNNEKEWANNPGRFISEYKPHTGNEFIETYEGLLPFHEMIAYFKKQREEYDKQLKADKKSKKTKKKKDVDRE
jgi:hypothetical protein